MCVDVYEERRSGGGRKKEGWKEGRKEGREGGRMEGRKGGRKDGRKEGRKEGRKRTRNAFNTRTNTSEGAGNKLTKRNLFNPPSSSSAASLFVHGQEMQRFTRLALTTTRLSVALRFRFLDCDGAGARIRKVRPERFELPTF